MEFRRVLFRSAAFATLFAAQAIAAPQTYSLDPTHSFPRFSYDHMGMSKQILRFNKTTGTVVLDQAAKQAHVDVTIDMTSIDTGFEMFDGHIQRADFLDTAKFPTATFKSTKVIFERSEEQTSELQSIMRISYAVSCLKKKTHKT